MTLGTAAEEIAKSNKIWDSSNVKALRAQQEEDFGWWGPYEYKMPKAEGKWDDETTNSPKILANKVIGLLSSSWLQLFIDVDDDVRKKREAISNTEQLANGCIWVADREAVAVPSGKRLQSALASYAVIKGGTAKSVYWYKDDDGKPRCAIKSYDPMFCQWLEGEKELLWFCYRNYVSKQFIEHTYKKQIEGGLTYGDVDTYNRILTYTFWDDEEWKIAIGEKYIDSFKHGLGYIPINVRSCGPAPYMQSEEYKDNTMKWSWQSYAMNTRKVYPLESKLLSIMATKAIDSGRKDILATYNSDKSNTLNDDVKKLGYGSGQRNNILFFDEAKGQKYLGFAEAPGNEVADSFYNRVRGELDIMATIDPVASGIMNRSGSGALADTLMRAALEFTNPFRECVEEDFKWIAEECVKQFKDGQYEKISVEGRDRKREKFYSDLEPKDVEEKHFECNLVADRLRDEIQELGAAIQKVKYGLSSRKTAMIAHNIVKDPDREMDNMDEELAAQDPVFKYNKLAKYWKDQGDEEMALLYMSLSKIAIESAVKKAMWAELAPPGMPGGDGGKPPVPGIGLSPQAETSQIATQPQKLREIGY